MCGVIRELAVEDRGGVAESSQLEQGVGLAELGGAKAPRLAVPLGTGDVVGRECEGLVELITGEQDPAARLFA